MPPSRFVLRCLLLVVLLLHTADCTKNCRDRCCTFLENFPGRLKELRTSFAKIRDYYEDKDEIETALLDEDVLKDFKSDFGCHAMNEVLRFYLDTVLPTAANEKASMDYRYPIDSIFYIFNELKRKQFTVPSEKLLFLQKPFELDSIMTSYKKMQGQGLYKAMGELGLLFNYIEEYMVSRKRKH